MGASTSVRMIEAATPANSVRPVDPDSSQVSLIPGGRGSRSSRPPESRTGRRVNAVSAMAGARRLGRAAASSSEMVDVLAMIERLAPTELTVTLIGETGTGKDVLAHTLHDHSARREHPFVVFDCGAVA